MSQEFKPKSFWRKPEGFTGALFLVAILAGAGFLAFNFLGWLMTAGLPVLIGVLGIAIFMGIDSKSRTLVSYMYKSAMRWITGLFIKIDPISVLKSYVDDLRKNLRKMNTQINRLRQQMHILQEMILNNKKDIKSNLTLAKEAQTQQNKNAVILKSRKAGRLKDSNVKLEDLHRKMEVIYRVLRKMYDNSYILTEDIEDQVKLKDQERKALMAGHSAMKSAMNIIKGDKDKKEMFDMALEAVADDVSNKVGEMERFMEVSESFMQSVDLQNGIFEDEGLKMLEKWEAESDSLLLGDAKEEILELANEDDDVLDLSEPIAEPERAGRDNQYDTFFD
jgi:peptidyl-tRNA hydrolase